MSGKNARFAAGFGQALAGGLRLSSEDELAKEKAREQERADYRRAYWQGYTKRVKRVYGTLSPADFAALQSRAEECGRTAWGQLWAESQAFISGDALPTLEIAEGQRNLIVEIRKIGNNINQLARLGHIEARKSGCGTRGLSPTPNDRIGLETARQLQKLEEKIAVFRKRARVPCDDC